MTMSKADKLFEQANKKSGKFDWFGISKQQNQEDAAELFAKAAAQYKIIKEYERAGLCYEKAAQCNMASDNDIEAKQSWREAGKCYRHCNFQKAIDAYRNAIELNLNADRFGQAARLEEEIGDILAEDDHNNEAIEAYEKAADYYEAENDTGNRNKRLLKVAHMCGKSKKWERAIQIFEKIAKDSVDNNLLRWKVKEYLFKGMLLNICMLADDDIMKRKTAKWPQSGQLIQERYCDISDIYASSREGKLISAFLQCLAESNIDAFKDAVAGHDNISKLDAWCFELVYFIEKYMEDKAVEAPNLDELDGGDEEEAKVDDAPPAKQANPFAAPANQNDLKDAPDLDDML